MDRQRLLNLPAEAVVEMYIQQANFFKRLEDENEFLKVTIIDLTKINLNLSSHTAVSPSPSIQTIKGGPPPQMLRVQYAKPMPPWAQTLVISDSSYRKLKQKDITNTSVINSYSSATLKDLKQTAGLYHPTSRAQHVVIHAGHNSLDQGSTPDAASKDIDDLIDAACDKFRPLKVFVSELPPVKNGRFGRDSNNAIITTFNANLQKSIEDAHVRHNGIQFKLITNNVAQEDICPTASIHQKTVE
jgi:hypothetical protein